MLKSGPLSLCLLYGSTLLLLGLAWACRSERVSPERKVVFPKGRIKVVTWNVHDLFDSIDDPYQDLVLPPSEVERKLKKIAQVLRKLDAQVVALQEVEKKELLERLVNAYLPDLGYRTVVFQEGNDVMRGIDVGLISKVPIVKVVTHKGDVLPYVMGGPRKPYFSRDCLEVHLGGGFPLILLVNHFKSKRGGGRRADAKRRSQALRVAEIVRALEYSEPDALLVVLGDLNDSLDSWALAPLKATLVDPLGGVQLSARYTSRFRGRLEVLDYILVNQAALPYVVKTQSGVFRDLEPGVSDHFPVLITLGTD